MDSVYPSVKVSVLDCVFSFKKKKFGFQPFPEHHCLIPLSRVLLSQLPRDLKPLQGPGKAPVGCVSASRVKPVSEGKQSVVTELPVLCVCWVHMSPCVLE